MESFDHLMHAAAEYFPVTVIAGCVLFGMVMKSLTAMVTGATRERSRREIAAYIAEGSITADHGERLMRAELNSRSARML